MFNRQQHRRRKIGSRIYDVAASAVAVAIDSGEPVQGLDITVIIFGLVEFDGHVRYGCRQQVDSGQRGRDVVGTDCGVTSTVARRDPGSHDGNRDRAGREFQAHSLEANRDGCASGDR